jgi:hypothetical protein
VTARIALALSLLLLATSARAEPYAPGATLPALELPDQHGEARKLDASTRAVVFSRDMSAGRIVKEAVAKAGNDVFDRNGAVYLVDLAGMPGFVRSLFAMPGLRRRPYKLMVDEEGTATTDFPAVEGKPTVLVLKALTVERVEHPADADALLKQIEPDAPAP